MRTETSSQDLRLLPHSPPVYRAGLETRLSVAEIDGWSNNWDIGGGVIVHRTGVCSRPEAHNSSTNSRRVARFLRFSAASIACFRRGLLV